MLDTPDTAQAPASPIFALSDSPTGQVIEVDDSVSFADQLLANLPTDWTVIHINSDSDSLDQLKQALQG